MRPIGGDDAESPEDAPLPGARAGVTTLSVDQPAPETRVRRFWLVVTKGPDSGATFTSAGERAVLGTADGADFVLHDPAVSRFHCEIAPGAGHVTLRDLGSKNGTLVNQVSVRDADLSHGCVLGLGRTEIRFELRRDDVAVPLSTSERFGAMVGRSVAMRRVFARLERAAESDATVLLEGETGTGKEVAAESIHRQSARRDQPMLVVDCGAIPPDLLESELFGHERGAFTGASGAREGVFEAASGGTIFLDEIGELALDLQPKLLRVMERREVKRVGANRYLPVDVRVVAATNRSLKALVNDRRFRADLYYRLAVVDVRLPALRERLEDLPALVEHLLTELGAQGRAEAAELRSEGFLANLGQHSWPGNVRELRNYLERCIALRETVPLASEPGEEGGAAPDMSLPLKDARERWNRVFERRYVEEMMRRHDGNAAAAARAAGVDRMHFYRLVWRHGLRGAPK
jgi:transcriptional regulator with PAS, ATPase and Fis domain